VDQIVSQSVVACIVNGRAGSNGAQRLSARVAELFREHGVQAETIVVDEGRDLVPIAHRYAESGCRIIVAAGGDGTVSAVASAVVGTPAALGVLPLGTLNHFAKDAGIPLMLDAAIETIIAGHTKLVDVGEVNGRIFINNSSIGLYPAIVQQRDRHQRRGLSKWTAFARAIYTVMRRMPHFHASLHADGKYDGTDKTPFIFVGNNPYHASGLQIGERQQLDSGRLWMCSAPNADRGALMKMAVRAFFGRATPGELKVLEAEELWVQTKRRRRLRVANDGEVMAMKAPLHFRIRPKALRIIVPLKA
jgi:YegS/Rv2252/BmrU family lipid kinase